ncbi:MAG: Helix-turn-helix domain [Pseudomonadota bacterium]|jgi:predicted site-specific integrase-resolvase
MSKITPENPVSFSDTELAVRLGVCVRTLLNWRKNGKAPRFFKRGQQVRYLLADIEVFEQDRKKKNKSQ